MPPPGRSIAASRRGSRSAVGVDGRERAAPHRPRAPRRPGRGTRRRRAAGAVKAGSSAAAGVGGQDRQPAERLHPLQQVADLEVGVAVVAVAHLGALAEQRVRLVEQQHRAAVLGGVEQPREVLLGLADVLAHHLAEVDHDEVEAQLAGDHLGRERLAGAARAGEQRGGAEPARAAGAKPQPSCTVARCRTGCDERAQLLGLRGAAARGRPSRRAARPAGPGRRSAAGPAPGTPTTAGRPWRPPRRRRRGRPRGRSNTAAASAISRAGTRTVPRRSRQRAAGPRPARGGQPGGRRSGRTGHRRRRSEQHHRRLDAGQGAQQPAGRRRRRRSRRRPPTPRRRAPPRVPSAAASRSRSPARRGRSDADSTSRVRPRARAAAAATGARFARCGPCSDDPVTGRPTPSRTRAAGSHERRRRAARGSRAGRSPRRSGSR